jgi:hypothetical protein
MASIFSFVDTRQLFGSIMRVSRSFMHHSCVIYRNFCGRENVAGEPGTMIISSISIRMIMIIIIIIIIIIYFLIFLNVW